MSELGKKNQTGIKPKNFATKVSENSEWLIYKSECLEEEAHTIITIQWQYKAEPGEPHRQTNMIYYTTEESRDKAFEKLTK